MTDYLIYLHEYLLSKKVYKKSSINLDFFYQNLVIRYPDVMSCRQFSRNRSINDIISIKNETF